MKFAPIIFHRLFRSHYLTVGPNLTVAIKNYLRSSDQSLIWQTTADYLRLLFPPTQVLPLPDFSSDFPSDLSGKWTPALIYLTVSLPCVHVSIDPCGSSVKKRVWRSSGVAECNDLNDVGLDLRFAIHSPPNALVLTSFKFLVRYTYWQSPRDSRRP